MPKPYKTITLRLNAGEYAHLQEQAEATGLKMEPLLRQLIMGVNLRPRPPDTYAALLRELSAIGNNIHQLSAKANSLNFIDAPALAKEAERWHKFQADVERQFLRPDKSELKWQ